MAFDALAKLAEYGRIGGVTSVTSHESPSGQKTVTFKFGKEGVANVNVTKADPACVAKIMGV
jgi:hypothetical protein